MLGLANTMLCVLSRSPTILPVLSYIFFFFFHLFCRIGVTTQSITLTVYHETFFWILKDSNEQIYGRSLYFIWFLFSASSEIRHFAVTDSINIINLVQYICIPVDLYQCLRCAYRSILIVCITVSFRHSLFQQKEIPSQS